MRLITWVTAGVLWLLWLAFSGKWDWTHTVIMGGGTVAFTIRLTNFLRRPVEQDLAKINPMRVPLFDVWLLWQIFKSSFQVAWTLIRVSYRKLIAFANDREAKLDDLIDGHLVYMNYEVPNRVARVMAGNSISLIPSTLTYWILHTGLYVFHCLHPHFAEGVPNLMARVARLFNIEIDEESIEMEFERFEPDASEVPQVFDHILGAGAMNTKGIALIMFYGVLYGRLDQFIDISIVYAMFNFGGPLVIAKYLERNAEVSDENGTRMRMYQLALIVFGLGAYIMVFLAFTTLPLHVTVLYTLGMGFFLVAGIGFFVLPSFFPRLYAGAKPETVGLILICAGSSFMVEWYVVPKVLLVAIIALVATPAASHALGRAALHCVSRKHRKMREHEVQTDVRETGVRIA